MSRKFGLFLVAAALLASAAPQAADARSAYTCRNRDNKPAVKVLCDVLYDAGRCRRFLNNPSIAKHIHWMKRARFAAVKTVPNRLYLKDSQVPKMLGYLKVLAPIVRDCLKEGPKANRRFSKAASTSGGWARKVAENKTFKKVEKVYDKMANAVDRARAAIRRYVSRKIDVMVEYAKSYVKRTLLRQLYRADKALRKHSKKIEKALDKIVAQAVKKATGYVLTKSRIERISKGVCRLPVIVTLVTSACSAIIGPAGFVCNKACPWAVGKVISWGKKKIDKYLAKKVAKYAMKYVNKYGNKAIQYAIRKVKAW